MRHEPEHARQWEAHGDAAFVPSKLIDDIYYERFADAPEEKYLYRAKPDEQDASGSAGTYLAGRFGNAPSGHLHTDRWYPLVWSYKPAEPMETLIVRSVCFLFQYSSLCEVVAIKKGKTFADMLEAIALDAAETWRVLRE